MRRREFIAFVGSAAAAWPVVARAQQPDKMWRIGFLGASTASNQNQWTAAFVQQLRELGWVEGRNLVIQYRWAEGNFDRSAQIIGEFVRLNVDVIVTHATPNVIAAKQTTSTIPIVFAAEATRSATG
jgi:putative ABC transport system substrate-binding protein